MPLEGVETASKQEKLQIVQHLLLSSPPGEFSEVLRDVMALVPEDFLSRPMLTGIARAYNNAHLKVAMAMDGTPVLLGKQGEESPMHYVVSCTGVRVQVDHVALTAEFSGGGPLLKSQQSNLESERVAVDKAVAAYVATHFAGDCKASAVHSVDADSKLKVDFSGECVNLRNFWSGNWCSEWTVVLDEGKAAVGGLAKVHAHYFEDGNVQLQTSKSYDAVLVASTSPEILGVEVVAAIQAAEMDLQHGLDNMYKNMSAETFKAMRRVMPVTRTKMKWNIHDASMNLKFRK